MKKRILIFTGTFTILLMNSCSLLQGRVGVNFNNLNIESTIIEEFEDEGPPTDFPTTSSINILKTSNKASVKRLDPEPYAPNDPNGSSFDTSNRTGFYIGIALTDILLTSKLKLQPEVNFIGLKGFNQFQVPILLKYNFTDKFNAYAGPNLGYLLEAPKGLNSLNFAVDFGVSYNITEKILIETRYNLGLTNLLENGNSDDHFKTNNIQIGLAYKFKL